MKNKLWVPLIIILLSFTSCQNKNKDEKTSLEENKKISTLYHERNLEDIDIVLADDFVGSYIQNESEPIIWDEEGHRNAIINYPDVKDSILVQIAENDWIATRFIRAFNNEGRIMKAEVMQFKQFKNGKVFRSWELFSPIQEVNETELEVSK